MTDVHRRGQYRGARRTPSGHRRRLSDAVWLLIGAIVFLVEIVAIVALFTALA